MFLPFIAFIMVLYSLYIIYIKQIARPIIDCNIQFKQQADQYQSLVNPCPNYQCYPMLSEFYRSMFEDANPSHYTNKWGTDPDYCG